MWRIESSIKPFPFAEIPSKFFAGEMMDPAKPVRTEPALQQRVRDWLQYGEELGLAPYYRDRPSKVEAVAAVADSSTPPDEEQVFFALALDTTTEDAQQLTPDQTPMPKKSILKSAASTVISPAHAETLFGDPFRVPDDSLPKIREFIGDCTRCKLSKTRTKIVFGTGNPNADLMFVGEGPGRDEDLSGEPFVGRAGKLLTDMIKAMGLQREDVYIANVVKCRPPENRLPEKDEIAACSPFLMRQIDAIKPKVICTLGSCSAQMLLQTTQGISKLRGEWFDFRDSKLMPTYHPAYLLRNPAAKTEVWKDLQKVMGVLGLQAPKKR
jgi:uracil-DNA glycosylase